MLDDIDLCDNDLHVAVRLGDIEATREALNEGFHPNTIGLFEWNALHEASFNGDIDILKLLLQNGGDPNKHDILSANTALHYASTENHPLCLDYLLSNGGDASVPNREGKTCVDLATRPSCQEVLEKHGHTCTKKKEVKSILKSSGDKQQGGNKTKNIGTLSGRIMPTSHAKPKQLQVPIESTPLPNEEERASSPLSVDSGTFSPSLKNFSQSKEAWNEMSGGLLQVPSSPARSQGSSYGSLTSLNSSNCSAADDCAGQFVLSFQYNSKKEEFKVRLWEMLLTSLLPASKMPKETNMHLYVKSTIIPDEQYEPNPLLSRKSEVFRLQAGETNLAASQNLPATNLMWNDKQARIEFKPSLSLNYTAITKKTVCSSAIKASIFMVPRNDYLVHIRRKSREIKFDYDFLKKIVSVLGLYYNETINILSPSSPSTDSSMVKNIGLCIRRKRSFLSTKGKPNVPDPVLASVELRMEGAVKKLMKESYDSDRHHILGITKQAFPLDGVVTETHSYDNHSYNSDPCVHIRMTSLSADNHAMTRSSSVGNLKDIKQRPSAFRKSAVGSKIDLGSEEGRDSGIDKSGTYSMSSLDSVRSHSSIPNQEVKIRLPLKKLSNRMNSVKIDSSADRGDKQGDDVKVTVPQSGPSSIYHEFKKKQAGDKSRGRIAQKAKTKLKSGSKALLSTAGLVVQPNVTAVTAFDEEEKTVGSPSEEDLGRGRLTFEDRLKIPQRLGSSGSLVRVDESPSPSRRTRRPWAVSVSPTSKTRSPESRTEPQSTQWSMNIDPEVKDTKVEIGEAKKIEFVQQVSRTPTKTNRTNKTNIEMSQLNSIPHSSHGRSSKTKEKSNNRPQSLRKLLYDESDFSEDLSTNNPCYIAD